MSHDTLLTVPICSSFTMILFRVYIVVLVLWMGCAMGQLPSQDILALLEFKKGIKEDPTDYVRNSWNEESIDFDGCPSSWNGIFCNGGNVAGVILDNLNLSGTVDLTVFSNLTKLVNLSMANNSLSGKLPGNIGDLKALRCLDLSNNLFFSDLPPGIGKLGKLQILSLAMNNFSSWIPDSISGLTSLQSLDLSGNSFSGSLPLSLTQLTSLRYLNLSHNGFVNKIPKGFDLIAGLEVIDLHGNMLEGDLDVDFLILTSSVHVDFSCNFLESSRAQKLRFLPEISETLKYLNLSHNSFSGSLLKGMEPQEFHSLKVLDLSYNELSGELPGFNFVYELEVFKLSHNRFTGVFPSELLKGDPLVLTELDLSSNNLSGPIHMITSITLHTVNLSSNSLSGELPLMTGSCAVLDLSNNHFEGDLNNIMKWETIESLDLSHNRLNGRIPEAAMQFLRLNYLNLSHNALRGSLSSITSTQYPKLQVLDLSNNQINESLPVDLLLLPTLQDLNLANNMLTGSVVFSSLAVDEPSLCVLDLSHNFLSGFFPDWVGSMAQLQVLNLAGNHLSGSLPTSMAVLKSLVLLDVSHNHLTGQLPSNLTDKLKQFNVSYNYFSGIVPQNLRRFPGSSFYPGNTKLTFPDRPSGLNISPARNSPRKHINTVVKVVVVVVCAFIVILLILLAIFTHYNRVTKTSRPEHSKDIQKHTPLPNPRLSHGSLAISSFATNRAEDKNSSLWSPESGDFFASENLTSLHAKSPERLVGELYFLDESVVLTAEDLSRAPAEVLGRSSHGTSYRATLDGGVFLTVKWLREGVARQRKDFSKECRKLGKIRHPNVVGLKGYYWGPSQHEKLILSDYISPGSLASFLYDRPGRRGSPLAWCQRLKIAVDIARGLNYLHFDRSVPHGNLKSTNILLDGPDLTARVADYCLDRLMTRSGTREQILDAGILGYRAPELGGESKNPMLSFKSDVYAFGVVLLEMLTGRCAGDVVCGEDGGVDLVDWVRLKVAAGGGGGLDWFEGALRLEMADSGLGKAMKEVARIALRAVCKVSDRPGIKAIYEDLSSV